MTPRSSWNLEGVAIGAWLVPLMLLMRPYRGLIQDARIYVGRGVADLDPGGVGRDMMFAHDEQSRFSIMRLIVRTLLAALSPGHVSMLLAFVGIVLWLLAAAALARSLAPGKAAWAAVVCMLVLPAQYGAFGVFSYAEAIATPRLFAQAAVLAGLAALLARRPALGLVSLAAALALHPLMALPGLALAAMLLVHDNRRWFILLPVGFVVLIGAAFLSVPLAARLFVPVDTVWITILRNRSTYLFPSRWPVEAFGSIASQTTVAILAGSLSAPRIRVLLWGTVGVALGGLAASWLFGDLFPNVLTAQLQPWRALWLLAVLSNAAVVPCAAWLWRRGPAARLTLALLALTWLSANSAALATLLGIATFCCHAAERRGALPAVPESAVRVALVGVAILAMAHLIDAGSVLSLLLRSIGEHGSEVTWPLVLATRVLTVPLIAATATVALSPWPRVTAPIGVVACAGVLAVFAAVTTLWDGRTTESRLTDARSGAPALRAMLAPSPGEVFWIDEDSENWFVAGRPAFLNATQAGPSLFSRDLALTWHDRATFLAGQGLLRPTEMAPWPDLSSRLDEISVQPGAVTAFCAYPSHPAALVMPGEQVASAPPGLFAGVWRPPAPIHRLSTDDAGIHWRTIDAFTVIRCRPSGTMPDLAPHT